MSWCLLLGLALAQSESPAVETSAVGPSAGDPPAEGFEGEQLDPETGLPFLDWDAEPEAEPEVFVPDPEMTRIYEARRLEVVDAASEIPGVTWIVRTGGGHVVDSFHFVRLVQDDEGQELLDSELRTARRTGVGIAAGGATMLALAAIPVARIDQSLSVPREADFTGQVNRDAYESDEEYLQALDFQEQRYQVALGEFQSQAGSNEDKRWMGLALASGGVMAMSVAPFAVQAMVEDRRPVAHLYDRARAEELVEAYNLGLKRELGLVPGTAPTPAEEDPWEEPEEEARNWSVRPQVGPAYVGVTFRF